MTTHTVAADGSKVLVATLSSGQWCIDTHGDYWGRGTVSGPMVCLFRSGGFTTDLDPSEFWIRETLPKGTRITITVGDE